MRKRRWWVLFVVAVLGTAGWWMACNRAQFRRTTPVFDGPSTALKRTVIVPTLDSPIPAGQNAIWCGTFALAWQQARDRVFHAPIQVNGAIDVARRLNNAPVSRFNLDPKDVYANAGRIEDGIVSTIRREMATKFPDAPSPSFPATSGTGVVAYAYFSTHMQFDIPFPQLPDGTLFVDNTRQETVIRAFGLNSGHECKLPELRKQVDVLFYEEKRPPSGRKSFEYAVDPCCTSEPYQLVLACVPPKATLAGTVADVQRRITGSKTSPGSGQMGRCDVLIVPEMCWRISHHFTELEGKRAHNPGRDGIDEASQMIDFTLDRNGVQLTSESKFVRQGAPRHLYFTHPFLLYMTRRGSDTPFFAMWVNNAELLNKEP